MLTYNKWESVDNVIQTFRSHLASQHFNSPVLSQIKRHIFIGRSGFMKNDYYIVTDIDAESLSRTVSEKLNAGYELYGDLKVIAVTKENDLPKIKIPCFIQALIKNS